MIETFEVELNMFKQGAIRKVEVPEFMLKGDDKENLETIYFFGQNDFQPRELPSVSMGDVIRYKEERWLVLGSGFRKLKEGDITVGYILPKPEDNNKEEV
jgi:hypothetical protein